MFICCPYLAGPEVVMGQSARGNARLEMEKC